MGVESLDPLDLNMLIEDVASVSRCALAVISWRIRIAFSRGTGQPSFAKGLDLARAEAVALSCFIDRSAVFIFHAPDPFQRAPFLASPIIHVH